MEKLREHFRNKKGNPGQSTPQENRLGTGKRAGNVARDPNGKKSRGSHEGSTAWPAKNDTGRRLEGRSTSVLDSA